MRNVEIKARVPNLEVLLARINQITGKQPVVIPQHDVFYKVPGGRLKLRRFEDGHAELIYYDRPDCEGPKLSTFEKCSLKDDVVQNMDSVLQKAFGIKTEVKKTRHLYMIGQTRVHVDKVKGLGDFVELEVCLDDTQTVEQGQEIANELMKKLAIKEDHLLATAYADLLEQ